MQPLIAFHTIENKPTSSNKFMIHITPKLEDMVSTINLKVDTTAVIPNDDDYVYFLGHFTLQENYSLKHVIANSWFILIKNHDENLLHCIHFHDDCDYDQKLKYIHKTSKGNPYYESIFYLHSIHQLNTDYI